MSTVAFSGRAQAANGPVLDFRAVVPDDEVDLADGPTRGLHVAGAGVLRVMAVDGAIAEFASGAAQYHPLRIRRVLASGTTATGVVALY